MGVKESLSDEVPFEQVPGAVKEGAGEYLQELLSRQKE
jgi:hypothetical protein